MIYCIKKIITKTLLKEIEEDTKKLRVCTHGLKELILLKCPYYIK